MPEKKPTATPAAKTPQASTNHLLTVTNTTDAVNGDVTSIDNLIASDGGDVPRRVAGAFVERWLAGKIQDNPCK